MRSVLPVKVVLPVAEWTVTSTPAVPLSVTDWPLAPVVKTGLGWRLTANVGTMPSNCRTKRSYPACSLVRAVITLATPVLPPAASAQAKAGRLVPGGEGGVTGGGEMRGAEATLELVPSGLTFALGVRSGPQAVASKIKTAQRPHLTGR